MANKKQFAFLNTAKALGIVFVVYTHLNQVLVFFETQLIAGNNKTFLLLERLSYAVGHLGVSLFIVASGFGLAHSLGKRKNINWKKWFAKRFSRIYVLFWASLILFLGARVAFDLFGVEPGVESTLFEIILTALGIQALFGYWGGNINAAYWFITLIITLYFTFPFISTYLRRPQWRKIVLLGLFSFIVGLFALNNSIESFRSLFLARIFEFSAGVALARVAKNKWFTSALPAMGATTLIIFIHSLGAYLLFNSLPLTVLFVITSGPLIFTTLMAAEAFWKRCKQQPMIKWLADHSYAIYLFHLPFIGVYIYFDHLPKWLYSIAAVCVGIGVAVVAQRLTTEIWTRLRGA